jgi:ribonuclease J
MEGTRFSGGSRGQQTEYELEEHIAKDIANAPGLVLASFSPQHVDRLVTFYKAARRAGRLLVLDHYGGFVLHLASGQARLPRPRASAGIRVLLPKSQETVATVARHFADCETTLEEILANPDRYVTLFRPRMIEEDFHGQLPAGVCCIYSFWSGYLRTRDWQEARTKVSGAGGTFLERHTSGHIHADEIVPFVNSIAPRWVVPVHTTRPEAFARRFPNARLLRDGECWDLQTSPQALVRITR